MTCRGERGQHGLADDKVPYIVRIADGNTHTVQTRIPLFCFMHPNQGHSVCPLYDRRRISAKSCHSSYPRRWRQLEGAVSGVRGWATVGVATW